MKKFVLSVFCFFIFHITVTAQSYTQVIRGTVVDRESKFPVYGATVIWMKDSLIMGGATTGENGEYRIENAAVGRWHLKVKSLGYKEIIINDVIVNSGKETILNVELQTSAREMAEVIVTNNQTGQGNNEMSTVSTRTFSIEETNEYAGSRGDPARMASNFAGVQGADDSRNDIVIRGNSPSGVLWRVEGADIFNPNHFNIPGTSGGPVSILNNKILANSEFYTGAFPAEFGNSVAGVFDLRLRNGNNEKHEFSGQFGFLGTELLAEGPFSKKYKASYLATYRYSTLALFSATGIDIGTDAVPHYQDGSFRINVPVKGNANFSLFGIGGKSNIDILISKQKTPQRNIYGQNDRDQYFSSQMGLIGASHSKSFNANTFAKFTVMFQGEQVDAHHELVYRHVANDEFVVDSLVPLLGYAFGQGKGTLAWYIVHKTGNKFSFKTGFNFDNFFFSFNDSIRQTDTSFADYYRFYKRWDEHSMAQLVQPYFEAHYKPSDAVTVNAGIHALYSSLGNALSPAEPRLGIRYEMKRNQSLNLGLGLHSQIQSPYLYFYSPVFSADGKPQEYNRNMGLTKSYHAVLGYDKVFNRKFYFKTEAYYQYLFNVPVTVKPSSFSLINTGVGFSRFFPDTLENKGTGQNYGIEFTLEKGFSRNYYFLATVSMFESNYKGSDGIQRPTDFDGQYVVNGVFTKEFEFKKKNVLQIGGKITVAGGKWYGPVDTVASEIQKEVVYKDATRNTLQMPSYFRADLKIEYRINRKEVTHEFGLDLVNVFNTRNVLSLTYAPDNLDPKASPIRFDYQLGRLPLFYYRIDF